METARHGAVDFQNNKHASSIEQGERPIKPPWERFRLQIQAATKAHGKAIANIFLTVM